MVIYFWFLKPMIIQAQFANSRQSKLISLSVMGMANVRIQTKQGRKQAVVIPDAELPSTEED